MQRTAQARTSADDTPVSYSVPRAAQLIGISARSTWDLVKTKKLRSFMEGGRRLVSRRALEEYVAAREAEAEKSAAA